jgi:beta-lactamase regulating signal transducer with metallopeptidase domain
MNTLMPIFDWILTASARASVLTVVVLLIQAALRHRVPARWRYALWLPVLVALLMPVFPESSWSVSSITRLGPVKKVEVPVMKQSTGDLPMPSIALGEVARSAPMPWRQILAVVWLSGVVSTVLIGLGSYVHTLRRYKRSRQPLSEDLQREIAGMVREVGLRRAPQVWWSAEVPSPAVTGVLRPVLLLPAQFEQTLAVHEARLVLKHELMHIKRGDLLVNALLCLLLSMHWFNPLMWFAFLKARFDREAACDAQVLGREGQVERVAYGHTLLKVETSFSHHGLSLGFVGIFQRGAALRSRIRFIAAKPNQHPLMKVTLSLGIVLLSFLGITQAATPAPGPKAPMIYISAKFVEITEQSPGPSFGAPPLSLLEGKKGTPGLIGTLTDPQFQVLIRALSQRKGVDLMAAPSVTTRSGQPARIEVVREFVYPDNKSRQVTENVGVFLELTPKVTVEEQITLALAPKVVEFEGFAPAEGAGPDSVSVRRVLHPDGTSTESVSDVVRGEVEESTYDAKGALISQTRVPYKKPVFSKREAKADVVLSSGQTVVLELNPRTDKQLREETDGAGRVIKSEIIFIQRRCFVFVTATLIDPMGKPPAPKSTSGAGKQ